MSKIVETPSCTVVHSTKSDLSFIETTKGEKKFNSKVYNDFIQGLKYRAFLGNPYDGVCPISVALDSPSNPVINNQFNAEYYDKYSHVRINAFNGGSTLCVYMQDLQNVIDALTMIQAGFNAAREAGVRDFPTIPGFDEWQAMQAKQNDDCFAALCN